jgi:hypothetical protein
MLKTVDEIVENDEVNVIMESSRSHSKSTKKKAYHEIQETGKDLNPDHLLGTRKKISTGIQLPSFVLAQYHS